MEKHKLYHCMRRLSLHVRITVTYTHTHTHNSAHARSYVYSTVRFLLPGNILSNIAPPDLPHQRIICKLWRSVIGRRPLMCPWAFSTQTESHRRVHTDNRAARHAFWKVTLRIAFLYIKKKKRAHAGMCMQANGRMETSLNSCARAQSK